MAEAYTNATVGSILQSMAVERGTLAVYGTAGDITTTTSSGLLWQINNSGTTMTYRSLTKEELAEQFADIFEEELETNKQKYERLHGR